MKILVPIKRVVDYRVKVRVKSDGSGVDTQHVKMSANPFDENALEEAIRLKERGNAHHITAISIGSSACQETLRSALAMGADEAVLLETDQSTEPLAVAKCLAAYINSMADADAYDLVIMGKQAIDDDCNQTGQMLASLLNWPQATYASELIIEAREAKVTREVDSGLETLTMTLPAVVTSDLRLNEPRYPTMPNIMKAKQKPLTTQSVSELGVDIEPRLTVLKTDTPPARVGGEMVKDISELLNKLHVNDKVL